jgi:hypothetical protein
MRDQASLQEEALNDRQRASPVVSNGPESGCVLPNRAIATALRAAGPGRQLPGLLAAELGEALHANLTAVRVHTGGYAQQLTQALGADAVTAGTAIFFDRGRYEPSSKAGRRLLAHESHHVVHPSREPTVTATGHGDERSADVFSTQSPMTQGMPPPMTQGAEPRASSLPPVAAVPGPFMLKRAPSATASVGGGGTMTFAPGAFGEEDRTLAIGEQGATRRALPLMVGAAEGNLTNYADAFLVNVGSPDFTELQERITYAAGQARKMDEEAEGTSIWGKPSPYFVNFYEGRAKEYREKVAQLTEQRYEEEEICASFNMFVPRGNVMFNSLARLEGLQNLLGVTDPEAMATAITESLDDARRTAERAGRGSVLLDLPRPDVQVGSAAAEVSVAARDMQIKWLGYAQMLSSGRVEQLQIAGAEDEERLEEIRTTIATWRSIGKTVDVSLSLMSGARALGAAAGTKEVRAKTKALGKTAGEAVGIPTDAEGVVGALVEFAHHDEIEQIEEALAVLNVQMEAERRVAQRLGIKQKVDEFESKKDDFVRASRRLQFALSSRQESYLQFGEQLDAAAKVDPRLRREGVAPTAGNERFSTVMLVTSAVREVLALGRAARDSFHTPAEIRSKYLAISRERTLSEPEYRPLVSIHSQISYFHANVAELERVLGPIDDKAGEMMKALLPERRTLSAGSGSSADIGGY